MTFRSAIITAVIFCSVAAPPCFPADDPLVFSASGWDFGSVDRSARPVLTLTARNRSADPVTVSVIPACECLSVEPARRIIDAGTTGGFRLSFDPSGEQGNVRRDVVILTSIAGSERMLFTVTGTVEGGPLAAAEPAAAASGSAAPPAEAGTAAAATRVRLVYYYTPGCRSCERFLGEEVPRLEREQGIAIDVERRDVLAAEGYDEYARVAASLGTSVRELPGLLVSSGVLLQGEREIAAQLPAALAGSGGTKPAAAPSSAIPPAAAAPAVGPAFAVLPVLAGGLLDGVNPCAFTTLIFLLASLAAAGRDRRQVLLVGILFTLAVFLTYFAVGLGLFSALRAAAAFPLVARLLRWLLVTVLAVFTILSVRDAVLATRGRAEDMTLQLPDSLKRRIRASIRARMGSTALAGAALVLGVLVSVFEFACTGQVYLPTLAYLARLGDARAVPLLAAYNLAYIVPLIAVFAAGWAGVSSHRLGAFLQRHLVAVKAVSAAFFAALAVLTLAT